MRGRKPWRIFEPAYEDLPDDATAEDSKQAEAEAWRSMGREARAAIMDDADPAAAPEPPRPLTAWRDDPRAGRRCLAARAGFPERGPLAACVHR